MSFFKKLKNRLFKSSSKLDEGLEAIVEDGGAIEEADDALALEAEERAREDEAERKAEADRAAAEAQRLEEERAAAEARKAEDERAAAEAKRLEEERAAAEAQRAEEERAAADAERLRIAEEEARAEAERAEAARLAAEQARQEEERARAEAEERARQEAERAELERRLEAERAEAKAEAERLAAEEEERARLVAEQEERARIEAERLATEQAERAEAARLAAEAEAAAAAEQARRAAEARAAEEAERARQEAEAAAERARQEAEAAAERERQQAEARAADEAKRAAAAAAAEAAAAPEPEVKKPGLLGRLFGRREKVAVLRRELDDDMLEQLEELLISADMGVDTALRVTANMAEGRFGKKLSVAEIKGLLAQEVSRIMDPVARPMPLYPKTPQVVLVVGVNGSGKTTTIGKLASQFRAAGKKVVIAAGDTFRAAAVEQLQVWGDRAGVPVLTAPEGSDPASLAFDAMQQAQRDGADLLMIDTAGRLQNRSDLMEELAKIVRVIRKVDETAPHNTLLVLDATTGQNALSQVKIFQEVSDVTGLVMTKLDGTAKGGVLVALADKFGLPIHAIGVGEQIDDLAPFDPEEFAAALTGLETEDAA